MKNVILIAPPAAGKGTLAQLLCDRLGYIQLSTGDMLREKAKTDQEISDMLKTGKLLSDELVFSILEEKLATLNDEVYILDGFPRTVEQAKMYKELLMKLNKEVGIVIYLDVDKEELKQRIITRLICPNCKKPYSTRNPELIPQKEGICDTCQVELYQRSDDTEEVFEQRYEEYLNKTQPLLDYYEQEGIVKRVDTVQVEDTYKKVLTMIK